QPKASLSGAMKKPSVYSGSPDSPHARPKAAARSGSEARRNSAVAVADGFCPRFTGGVSPVLGRSQPERPWVHDPLWVEGALHCFSKAHSFGPNPIPIGIVAGDLPIDPPEARIKLLTITPKFYHGEAARRSCRPRQPFSHDLVAERRPVQRRDFVFPVEGRLDEEFRPNRHCHDRDNDALLGERLCAVGKKRFVRCNDLLRIAERKHAMDRDPALAIAAQHPAERTKWLRAHDLRDAVLNL